MISTGASGAEYGPECMNTSDGSDYRGQLAVTVDGITCQAWNTDHPRTNHARNPANYPDTTIADAQNFCRNPDQEIQLWCYTTDPGVRWDYCHNPHFCSKL